MKRHNATGWNGGSIRKSGLEVSARKLSELLGLPVYDSDGTHQGSLIDVRLSVTGDMGDRPDAPKVLGVIVSPHSRSSYLGYERRRVDQPRVLARLLRWRHRGTFLTLWDDIDDVTGDRLTLRNGATKYSPRLKRACGATTSAPSTATNRRTDIPPEVTTSGRRAPASQTPRAHRLVR